MTWKQSEKIREATTVHESAVIRKEKERAKEEEEGRRKITLLNRSSTEKQES